LAPLKSRPFSASTAFWAAASESYSTKQNFCLLSTSTQQTRSFSYSTDHIMHPIHSIRLRRWGGERTFTFGLSKKRSEWVSGSFYVQLHAL